MKEFKSRVGVAPKKRFWSTVFSLRKWTKINFLDQNRLLTRDHNFRRENTVDQTRFLGGTPTRDLNSFKHFSGPKNKTLRTCDKNPKRNQKPLDKTMFWFL